MITIQFPHISISHRVSDRCR